MSEPLEHYENSIYVDSLVIGSGIAGLNVARKLAQAGQKVFIASKDAITEGSSKYAQGGVAVCSPLNPEDQLESHISDTLDAGKGLCNEKAVETILNSGWAKVEEIIKLGVEFDDEFNIEGSHSYKRVMHVADTTGRAIIKPLIDNISKNQYVSISQGTRCLSLIQYEDRVIGALFETISGEEFQVFAQSTVLATGGLSSLYEQSTNPTVSTGDGIALAYDAGAKIENLEFVQFHPTVFRTKGGENFLISEAVRGAGALLRNAKRELFAQKYHPDAELATRDIVSRAIVQEIKATNSEFVYLDFREMDTAKLHKDFPNIYAKCKENGFDLEKDLLPVFPAAHYSIGGIKTEPNARTNVNGLYAIGEVASTGLHGANRLASNSLLECLVVSDFAAQDILKEEFSTKERNDALVSSEDKEFVLRDKLLEGSIDSYDMDFPSNYEISNIEQVREILSSRLGIERNRSKIKSAIKELEEMEDSKEKTVGLLLAKSAMMREESRGAHFRLDFPKTRDEFKRSTIISGSSRLSENPFVGTSTAKQEASTISNAHTATVAAKKVRRVFLSK